MPTALELYAEAFVLQSSGKADEAERRYRDLIAQQPEAPECRYARVQIEEMEARRKAPSSRGVKAEPPVPPLLSPPVSPTGIQPVAPSPIQILVSPQQAAHGDEARPAAPHGAEVHPVRPVSAYPLEFVPAFSILGMVGFSLAVLLSVAVIALGVMVRTQGRAVDFQSDMIKAHAALQQGEDVAFLRSIADAKSYGLRDNAPNLLAAEYFLRKKDFRSVQNELRNCPVFDEEVKAFIEKVKRVQKGG